MLCPASLHARLVETLNIAGCGFVLVELPGVCHGLCIASLYLHDSLGITLEPNKNHYSHPDGFAQAHKELGCHWEIGMSKFRTSSPALWLKTVGASF